MDSSSQQENYDLGEDFLSQLLPLDYTLDNFFIDDRTRPPNLTEGSTLPSNASDTSRTGLCTEKSTFEASIDHELMANAQQCSDEWTRIMDQASRSLDGFDWSFINEHAQTISSIPMDEVDWGKRANNLDDPWPPQHALSPLEATENSTGSLPPISDQSSFREEDQAANAKTTSLSYAQSSFALPSMSTKRTSHESNQPSVSYFEDSPIRSTPSDHLDCCHCKESFASFPDLHQHNEDAHSRSRHCLQDGCRWSFQHAKDLRRHMNSKHDEKRGSHCPFHCCAWHRKGFTRYDSYLKHMKRKHGIEVQRDGSVGSLKCCIDRG